MTRSRLTAIVLAALVLAVPAVAGGAAPAIAGRSMLGANQVTTGDRVPWKLVGSGWYLTLIDQGAHGEFGIEADHQLLDLVDPLGGRYQIAKTAVGTNGGYRRLVDWSADGRRALELVDEGTRHARAVVYRLEAGTHHSIPLGRGVSGIAFGPHGSIYETRYAGNHGEPLDRRSASGVTSRLATGTDAAPLPTPNGRRVVIGTNAFRDHHLLIVDRDGVAARIATPEKCSATRWWKPGVVMARCDDHAGSFRLYAAPIDGSRGHWISADHGKRSADLGDLDARRLGGTTYLEAGGACGYVFLARQRRDGAATKVHVPGTESGNVYLLGTRGHRLVLQHGVTCDGGATVRDAISHFDPRTGHDRVVAELPANEAYGPILAYGERRAQLG
jgi:hypothetical protein